MKSQINWPEVRLALPEVIGLAPEQCDRAQTFSQPVTDENQRWQTYLNALAYLALQQWLGDQVKDFPVQYHPDVTAFSGTVNIHDFKLRVIATEHVLDEIVVIPQDWITQSELAADFYVVLEVLEEQSCVIIRGVLRYDQLVRYGRQIGLQTSSQNDYQLPLDLFDPEINHLLVYLQFLPAIGTKPMMAAPLKAMKPLTRSHPSTRTRLSEWMQNVFDDGWLTLDRLIHPETQLALGLRNSDLHHPNGGTKRGRLIDLEMQMGVETVALLVTLTPASPTQFMTLIQLHPTGGNRYLPPDLKLILHSKAGKLLQEVTARHQDNYIQLKPFKGNIGKQFSVAIGLGDQEITEDFEF
jgi:hypothetical protein